MLCPPKRTPRLCDGVAVFPRIAENDTIIELDSLEAQGEIFDDDELQEVVLPQVECFMDEIVLPAESLQSLSDLKVLSLKSNGIQSFPGSILRLVTLLTLDLSDNSLLTIPPEICALENLVELVLDQNLLSVLPNTLWKLKELKTLKVARNRLALPPDKAGDMRALILAETELNPENQQKPSNLTTLNLRSNRLKGNIILGNYGNLTELDVSENSIENLDLSAVEQLEMLQCSRNSIVELTLHGRNLTSIIAGNNKLRHLIVLNPPTELRHLDVCYNELEVLPNWLSSCSQLRCLFASNNLLNTLPENFLSSDFPHLHTLQIAYNHLHKLPPIRRRFPVREIFLQNNSISSLPENFFKLFKDVRVFNVANNRLCDLPIPEDILQIEKLFITANCLVDESLEQISRYLQNIKILHAAYNSFTSLPENVSSHWPEVEELVFSGNKLLQLPESINRLKHLSVLRVHSNLLQTIPKLSNLQALRVLDLAHNQLDRIDLTSLIPPNLKFLDLSCNSKLHVDSQQFHTYRTQRPMSLVDVSGKNRTSLPLTPSPFCENDLTEQSWSVGFSETSGCKQRLYVAQIRLPAFCNTEGLFGMFDGEINSNVPVGVDKVVPRILLEERTVKETASDYMKYTMLSSHRELRDKGQKHGLNAIICHIVRNKQSVEYSFCASSKKYTMKIASVGDIRLVLGRAAGPVRLLPVKPKKQMRTTPQLQFMVPDPDVTEILLEEQDEFMIIANRNLWDVMTPETAIREVALQRNVILAAKRLQDLAQSYGAEDNLSVIVVKFNLIGGDVDLLMRELRQTIRKNQHRYHPAPCQPGCCCETLSNDCIPLPPPMQLNEDRSSPSGQSEPTCSDCTSSGRLFVNQLNRSIRSVTPSIFETVVKSNPERRSYRGVAKALRARREEERNQDSDSALSEEQFKCWEYMLEQNTQLLFDKELNTLTKGMKKSLGVKKALSRSNPLLTSDGNNNQQASFLSRQFGSARSFNPVLCKAGSRIGLGEKGRVVGGPHAAYFGSLQRLMPYNLEYDFAVMHERGLADSMELDRMQQYWGVTTTEL